MLYLLALGMFLGLGGCNNKASKPLSEAIATPPASPEPPTAPVRVTVTKTTSPSTATSPPPSPAPRRLVNDPSKDDAAGANGKGTRDVSTVGNTAPQLL
jgi:hypothetical protein